MSLRKKKEEKIDAIINIKNVPGRRKKSSPEREGETSPPSGKKNHILRKKSVAKK